MDENLLQSEMTGSFSETAIQSNEANPESGEWLVPERVIPLITELEIKQRTAKIARKVAENHHGKNLVVVAVLKGSFMFVSDLLRRLYDCKVTPQVDFIRAASYGYGDISTGKVSLQLDVSLKLSGCNVLLIDDIADTGVTLSYLVKHILRKGAVKVETCVLLDKPSRRTVPFTPDYIGFEIADQFVVGYGLDFGEKYRNIPFIVALERPVE